MIASGRASAGARTIPRRRARPRVVLAGVLALSALAVWIGREGLAREGAERPADPSEAVEDDAAWGRVAEQLDEVIAGQEAILARFNDLMDELAIVKVRATRRRAP